MRSRSFKSNSAPLLAALAAATCFLWSAWPGALAQSAGAGRIIGHIDGLRFEIDGYYVWGWACQQGQKDSIAVHLYAQDSLMLGGNADMESEPAVNRNCQDSHGGKHRFAIGIPSQDLAAHKGKKLYVRGIRIIGAVENAAIAESGTRTLPDAPVFRTVPQTYPALSGSYHRSAAHPFVFTTETEVKDLVQRINTPGTFSSQGFAKLANQVKKDLTGKTDWTAAYSGCDAEIYVRGFSVEAKPAYGNDRSEAQLAAAMSVRPGAEAPHGAAIAASRLALYAVLVESGAHPPAGAPGSKDTMLLSKRILLAWTDHGFRDEHGNFRAQYCDLDARGNDSWNQGKTATALTFSRGVVYSIHAQDLLESLHAISPEEEARLNTFHREMYDWIRTTHNDEVKRGLQSRHPDEIYSNQGQAHLTALLATSRLLDDEERFNAVLYGGQGPNVVELPWVRHFDVIYGPSDRPFLRITPNWNDDPFDRMNGAGYSTKIVAAGEINDRFRNLNPLQSIGYSMGTLEWLVDSAEILRIAGLDPYGYRGAHQQSIEMAVQYYACYAKNVGFYKTVTAQNAKSCPDYQQYIGKLVNSVESMVVVGAYRFPNNPAITELDLNAKQLAPPFVFSPSSILFGKWQH